MRFSGLTIKNYRSIVDSGNIRIESLQAFVGENNAGKSNLLRGISCFLSVGAGGVQCSDLHNQAEPMFIEAEFTDLSEIERRNLKRYLLGDKLIIQKQLVCVEDDKTGKEKLDVSYHGYMAEPRDCWLSISKIHDEKGQRPRWAEIAEENGILEYVIKDDGRVDKKSYEAGISRIIIERDDIEFDEPVLADGKAMGIQQNLLRFLPDFYLLPAITDYSDEIDKRSSNTVFRKLMGDLSDRIIKEDPRYNEIEQALNTLRNLLNPQNQDGSENDRLAVLGTVEQALKDVIAKLMPTVEQVQLEVAIEETKELFSKGVALKVHDGVMTDVLDKGHGMQRSVVFGLLQMLIKNVRGEIQAPEVHQEPNEHKGIVLAIEEPELYIHPQSQRLIYRVLEDFAGIGVEDRQFHDQVIYTTHSPAFVDIAAYEQVGMVVKKDVGTGSKVNQCEEGVLGDVEQRRGFKLLNSFDLKHNEMFFARHSILVEGEQDEIMIMATGRKIGAFEEFPEEVGYSIVVCGNKEEIPKFQKILNAFNADYSVLLEMDGKPIEEGKNAEIIELSGTNVVAQMPNRMEDAAGLNEHFKDTFACKKHFSDHNNVTEVLEEIVRQLFHIDPVGGG